MLTFESTGPWRRLKAIMPRAIWKGSITFDDVHVPVKLYSAIEDRSVHFRLLHADDQTPVKQQMVDQRTGKTVPPEEQQRGIEMEDGVFVVIGPDDLASIEPDPSRDIDVQCFLDADAIDEPWFDRPYWVGPDGSEKEYAALVEALASTDTVGLARWTMRKRSYVGALRPHGDHLMLVTLHHAGEVIPVSALPKPKGREPSTAELKLAQQLVDALADDFDASAYEDEYRTAVLELVEAKAEGKTVRLPKPTARKTEGSLQQALEQSLKASKNKKRKGAKVA